MAQVLLGKFNYMKNRSKAFKIYTVVMIIVSITVLIYCFFFYLDYAVTYKYTIDNGLSNTDIIYPKVKREAEINYLLFLSKAIMGYSIFVIIGLIMWLFGKRDKNLAE
jgi:hypothetical protein